jgi:tetratricopeptide (TPR) repeat protein
LFEVAELAARLGDNNTVFEAASLLAGRPEPGSVDERQLSVLEQAHAALPESDGRRVLLLAMQAKSLAYASTRDERIRRGLMALGQARKLVEPELREQALTRCLDALVGPDHLHERCEIAAELLQMAEARGEAGALLRAWAAQIETSVELGDMPAVDTALRSMEELAIRVREPLYRWQARAVRSMQAYVQGKLSRAEQLANEALQLGAAISEELARHIYCAQTFSLFLVTGQLGQAERIGCEMADKYPGIAGWVAARGISHVFAGQSDAARACLDDIMSRGVDWIAREPYLLSGLCSVSELCQLVGTQDMAQTLYQLILPYANHHGLTHMAANSYGPMTHQLAGLAACARDFDLAQRHYREALHAAEDLGSPTFTCLTARAYAATLLESGHSDQRAQARALLGRARRLAAEHGMTAVLFASDQLAQQHRIDDSTPNVVPLHKPRRSSGGSGKAHLD